ncbi:hypothetical protein ERO13_D02G180833v2 [Gossypium hirsutum]|uniref:Uncharacterized protein n=3 Tax=Gossypium TaxID=3633 RepID=A0A5J5SG51_GOSBA|nr:hypothetical protein ES319_D02G208400v1 [Gossypium barbadense]KAG4159549.1 hypothetical protein ERO13_D02G180833v2 [Gossypium hirsutum]TYG80533.1 hypothetical protein ES288_D02G223800v1 [Gossypium darwinii]TYI94564.1 hypothetical protein E1A91_D02G213200v1 [Gossypium mustelinum]
MDNFQFQAVNVQPILDVSSWMLHGEFKALVDSSWNSSESIVDNIEQVYGNMFSCKHNLIVELTRVQRILEVRDSPRLSNRELELKQEIEEVLKHEELSWSQKS